MLQSFGMESVSLCCNNSSSSSIFVIMHGKHVIPQFFELLRGIKHRQLNFSSVFNECLRLILKVAKKSQKNPLKCIKTVSCSYSFSLILLLFDVCWQRSEILCGRLVVIPKLFQLMELIECILQWYTKSHCQCHHFKMCSAELLCKSAILKHYFNLNGLQSR